MRLGQETCRKIANARFPFASKPMAMGYCIWGMERASLEEKSEFDADCAALEETLQPDDEMRAKALRFADALR